MMGIIEIKGDGFDGDVGGTCPVQGEGEIDGKRWYFRARGRRWRFGVGATEDDALDGVLFETGGSYGESQFEAGYMPLEDAERLIRESIAKYRTR